MDFMEAVSACLSKYATFNGRARRSEYWWFALFCGFLGVIMAIIETLGTAGAILSLIINLALIIPSLAVGCRRLHDINKSGWWQLLVLIPIIGWIILIIWFATDTKREENQYGAPAK